MTPRLLNTHKTYDLKAIDGENKESTEDEARMTDRIRSAWKTLKDADQKIKALHDEGFIHQDLHLDNIMMVKDEAGIHAALIDFEKSKPMPETERAATREIEYDRRFILQAALLVGFKIIDFQGDPLFKEAFDTRKQLFSFFADMNLAECSQAVARIRPF